MSGPITAVASHLPIQLSSVGCQSTTGYMTAVVAAQLSTATSATMATSHNNGSFGNVLSSKMNGSIANSPASASCTPRAGTTVAEMNSSKNQAADKSGKEKGDVQDYSLTPAVFAAAIVPAPSLINTLQVNPDPSRTGLGGAPAIAEVTVKDGSAILADPLVLAPSVQTASAIAPASAAPARDASASVSAPPTDQQDATTAPLSQGPISQSVSDQLKSAALPFAGVAVCRQELPSSQSPATETAGLTVTGANVSAPQRLADGQPDLRRSASENATQECGSSAAATTATPDRVRTASVAAPVAEDLSKMQQVASYTISVSAQNAGAASDGNSDRANQNDQTHTLAREAGTWRPVAQVQSPGAITSAQAIPAEQVKIGGFPPPKPDGPTQPLHASALHDEQHDPGGPASTVLPTAGTGAASGLASREAKMQPPSDPATSSPAENAEAPRVAIQSSQVLDRMGKSEIRLGLNSSNFGNIELHTSVNQDRVGTIIATGHAELRAAMVAEMPSLERGIALHQMRLDSFQLDSRPGAQSGDSGASGGNQSGTRSGPHSAGKASDLTEDSPAQEGSLAQAWTASRSGLNVHA